MTRLSCGRHGYCVDMADNEMELGRRLHGQVRNEVRLVFFPIVQPPSGHNRGNKKNREERVR